MAGFVNVTTKMFFDRAGVIAAMDEKSRKCLSSALAFGRTVMKRGMRRKKAASPPGGFPNAHSNSLLRDLIYFGFDVQRLEGVVGPTLISADKSLIASSGKTVPQLINEGGTVLRRVSYSRGRHKPRREVIRQQHYRARPFVDLTLPKAAAKLAENMEKFGLRKVG